MCAVHNIVIIIIITVIISLRSETKKKKLNLRMRAPFENKKKLGKTLFCSEAHHFDATFFFCMQSHFYMHSCVCHPVLRFWEYDEVSSLMCHSRRRSGSDWWCPVRGGDRNWNTFEMFILHWMWRGIRRNVQNKQNHGNITCGNG